MATKTTIGYVLERRREQLARSAVQNEKYKSKGICRVCCNNPVDKRRSVICCSDCMDRANRRRKARKQQKVSAGVCNKCGVLAPAANRMICEQCHHHQKSWHATRRAMRVVNGLCTTCGNTLARKEEGEANLQCTACLNKAREVYLRLRREVYAAYGGKCECCGEAHPFFLAIDHVNGGGERERKIRSTSGILLRIRRLGFPNSYRLLCHNCNSAIGYYGTCPHKLTSK